LHPRRGDVTIRAIMSDGLDGECSPRFSRVREVFAASLAAGVELGAAVAVTKDGAPVVGLWGGFTDKARTRPWEADTLVNVYSTTKGLLAACAHRLVDQGKLDMYAPVARYWPEFAQAGKGGITVGMLLDHRAGLPAVRETQPPEALFSWEAMTTALAAETPWWEPGTKHGYHPFTFGWLVGEVVHRAAGKMPGRYFADEIAGPLGLDAHIGLAEADDARCSDVRSAPRDPAMGTTLFERLMAEPESMATRAFTNPVSMVLPGTVTSRAWRGAEIPAANAHVTASAVARFYGALARGGEVDGVRVLSEQAIARCLAERTRGLDLVLDVETRFSLGYMLSVPGAMFGPNSRVFGHPGAGGSVGFADVDARIGFAYVTNRMGAHLQIDPRATALIDAVYASL
jgi:CubicO group peptidase (beta-lactamase class C family)